MSGFILAYLIVALLCMIASIGFAIFMAHTLEPEERQGIPLGIVCLCIVSLFWPVAIFGAILAILDEEIRRKKGD